MQKIKTLLLTGMGMLLASPALAQVDWGMNYAQDVGLGTREVREVAVDVIQTLLSILGILALIIILIGGFRWMTAMGKEEQIESAKKTIAAGVIGLIIIFFAYAIVAFVFDVVGESISQ